MGGFSALGVVTVPIHRLCEAIILLTLVVGRPLPHAHFRYPDQYIVAGGARLSRVREDSGRRAQTDGRQVSGPSMLKQTCILEVASGSHSQRDLRLSP